jgi:Kef-type K+ transport system membrane component KefB
LPAEQGILASTEFQMSLLLFVALAGYLIAYRINQSAVVGIILAGIIVGPSLLGLVTYTDFVAALAHIGAIVLLFTIGLEFEIREIVNLKYFFIALLGIILPWAGGFFLAELFGFDYAASIFVGTALTATSIAITANVLQEMGKLKSTAGKAIIGAAIIDDVLALFALTISEEIVAQMISPSLILIMVAKAVVFIAAAIFLGKAVIGKSLVKIDATKIAHKYPESVFIYAIMIAFLYSMAAEFVGLSAIIGSFLAGACFASIKLESGKIFKEGAEHLQIIFASIFFISLGVLIDLHIITLELIWFILALTVVAMLTKIIGCGLPAILGKMDWKDSLAIGIGMAPRGEIAMVVALIGFSNKIIMQDTYAALVLMSLLTTLIPPLIFRNWLFKETRREKL